jgi:hypothetical protein
MFDPGKRVSVDISKLKWARFKYNLKLWLMMSLLLGIPFALIVWVIMEYFQ